MSIITTYITREFAKLFLLCLCTCVALFFVIDFSLQFIDNLEKYNPPLLLSLVACLYKLPQMFYWVFPVATLLATFLTLALFSRSNEITAMMASGISIYSIITPLLVLSCCVILAAFCNQELALPYASQKAKYIENIQIKQKKGHRLLKQDRFWYRTENAICNIELFEHTTNTLYGITVLSGAVAYGDVEAAFQHYLDNDNNGRPFVLIGHSQGARMLQTLVQRRIDGQPLQQRMLSAMLLGSNLSVPDGADVGGAFQNVPLCRTPQQSGCAISYVSFRADAPPPANSRFGVSTEQGRHVACTNPAALGSDAQVGLDAYLGARGAGQSSRPPGPWVNGGPEIRTGFVKVPGLLSARCQRDEHGSYLAVTVHADAGDPRTDDIVGDVMSGDRVLADWGLHLLDVSLTQGHLIELVRTQAAAYASR